LDARHPPAEVDVDAGLVRRLLESQHPDFPSDDLVLIDEGWDNVTYRVGPDHAVRIPRREVAVQLLRNEQRWLPTVGPRVGLAVPLPVAVGAPSDDYPWPWSIVEWVPGTPAEVGSLSSDDAEALAAGLRSLHRTAPSDAPSNPFRGVPLRERREAVEPRLARLGLAEITRLWHRALEADDATGRVWLHGDLHPRNTLVRSGRLSGLIDWGDMNGGDAATDLACAWMLFGPKAREAFLEAYAPSPEQRARALGWAVNFGSALIESGEARHEAIGTVIVEQLVSAR
jgi:aminoglycoside phosphotransferase (APT) family kinase protein